MRCTLCLQKSEIVGDKGTTTNGRYMLKFKRGAFLAGLPVQPVVLIYSSHWISPAWETITGPRHIRLLLSTPYTSVRIAHVVFREARCDGRSLF